MDSSKPSNQGETLYTYSLTMFYCIASPLRMTKSVVKIDHRSQPQFLYSPSTLLHLFAFPGEHMESAIANATHSPCSKRRRDHRRRRRDSVKIALFSYVRSQCRLSIHNALDVDSYCTARNCSFYNIQCLVKLLRSAKKTIRIAMYQFSVDDLLGAILYAKARAEERGDELVVQCIMDRKMASNDGTVRNTMIREGEIQVVNSKTNDFLTRGCRGVANYPRVVSRLFRVSI